MLNIVAGMVVVLHNESDKNSNLKIAFFKQKTVTNNIQYYWLIRRQTVNAHGLLSKGKINPIHNLIERKLSTFFWM